MNVVGRAVADDARVTRLPLGHLGKLGPHQARQREILEKILHELVTGYLEDELIFPLTVLAGLRAAPTGTATFGSRNAVPAEEFFIARMHDLSSASRSMTEDRF